MASFGEKVKYIREELLKMTQEEFGTSIHFTQAAVNAVEKGKNKNGSFEFFKQLVLVHHVNPMYFIYEKSNEPIILKREGSGNKPLLHKLAKYEKKIGELHDIMKGK